MAALIVENGTGLATADSYISVADATAYHERMGTPAASWDNLDDEDAKAPALRRATMYMVQVYRFLWEGTRKTSIQALDWPRYEVAIKDTPSFYGGWPSYYPSDLVPQEVKNACAELAVRAAAGDLLADLDTPVIREKVGPIETEYAVGARQYKRYPAIEKLLEPYLTGSSNSFSLVRS